MPPPGILDRLPIRPLSEYVGPKKGTRRYALNARNPRIGGSAAHLRYNVRPPTAKRTTVPLPPRGGARSMQDYSMEQFAEMLSSKQQSSLDALLADSKRRTQGELMSMAGFGAALQGYSSDLWGQTGESYRQAAAAQQSAAQGLGGQVGSGIAEARAQQAALAGQLGYTGGTTLPTPEQGAAQVASEGGARTGEMIGQVGTAWGGYGATRPESIGFMTGQNQMQVLREQIEADRDLKSKFLELSMDNPKTALDMWTAMQENQRQNVSTNIAQQTLKTNIAMQRAKLKQSYAEMRARAKTDAEKLALDREEFRQNTILDQQDLAIDQQNATSRAISAGASASHAATAEWKARHPTPRLPTPPKYATGDYQTKVASAMYNAPQLFSQSGGDRAAYAFRILWPQMARFVSPGSKKAARDLLMARLRKAAKVYKPKPSSGGGASYGGVGRGG